MHHDTAQGSETILVFFPAGFSENQLDFGATASGKGTSFLLAWRLQLLLPDSLWRLEHPRGMEPSMCSISQRKKWRKGISSLPCAKAEPFISRPQSVRAGAGFCGSFSPFVVPFQPFCCVFPLFMLPVPGRPLAHEPAPKISRFTSLLEHGNGLRRGADIQDNVVMGQGWDKHSLVSGNVGRIRTNPG